MATKIIGGLNWFTARNLARQDGALIWPTSWNNRGGKISCPMVDGRLGGLWYFVDTHTQPVEGFTPSPPRVIEAPDLTRDDFLGLWSAEVEESVNIGGGDGGGAPGSGGGGWDDAPGSGGGWGGGGGDGGGDGSGLQGGGGGDVHIYLGPCGPRSSKVLFDDNVPSDPGADGRILYAGVNIGGGAVAEVWYGQMAVSSEAARATNYLRLVDTETGVLELKIIDGEHWIFLNDEPLNTFTGTSDFSAIVPTSEAYPGPDNGAFQVRVDAKDSLGYQWFNWSVRLASMRNIPNLRGGLALIVSNLINAPKIYDAIPMTGIGYDGWSRIGAGYGVSRDHLKHPYSGPTLAMGPGAWEMALKGLERLGCKPHDFPWDPLPQDELHNPPYES